jgi:class 3 adenylate cyclase
MLWVSAVQIGVCLGMLAGSFLGGFCRFWQPAMSVAAIIFTLVGSYLWIPLADHFRAVSSPAMWQIVSVAKAREFVFGSMPIVVAVYAALRMRVLYAVPPAWSVVILSTFVCRFLFDLPGVVVAAILLPMLLVNFLGMFACYAMERSARADFLAEHLLRIERQRAEDLLLNVLPAAVAERLKQHPGIIADSFSEVTVLFADIAEFTRHSALCAPEELVRLLNEVFSCFDRLAEARGLEKIKTIGDSYMVVGGLPEPRRDHAEAVAGLALDIQREMQRFRWPNGEPMGLRIGINTGPVVAGVIGVRKFIYDLWGDTVNVANRMERNGILNGIQVTETTYGQLKDQYAFEERYLRDVKGKGDMRVFRLLGPGPQNKQSEGSFRLADCAE